MTAAVHFSVRPEWAEIDKVRDQTLAFLRQQGFGDEIIDAMTMVACELTENATKYGQFDPRRDHIDIDVMVDARFVTCEVKSPVSAAEQDNLARLDRMVQWIRGYQDPFQAYLERLKEVSVQNLESKESGLGLVRIAYEGQAILDFYVDEHNTLSVSATYPL